MWYFSRIPAILLFVFNSQTELEWYDSLETTSNVIDIAVADNGETIFYSLDNTHERFTRTAMLSEDVIRNRPCMGAYNIAPILEDRTNVGVESIDLVSAMDQWEKENACVNNREINSWLYSLETLRKKTQED